MDEKQLSTRIDELAREAHALFKRQSRYRATYADRERLEHVQIMLDQSWDLLRRRRARLAAGLDPDEPHATTSRAVLSRPHRAQIDRVVKSPDCDDALGHRESGRLRERHDLRENVTGDGRQYEEPGYRPGDPGDRATKDGDSLLGKIENLASDHDQIGGRTGQESQGSDPGNEQRTSSEPQTEVSGQSISTPAVHPRCTGASRYRG